MKTLLTLSLAFALLIFPAIAEDEPDSSANVMFIHASPDAPTLDIKCSGDKLDAEITYSEITGYEQISPGLHDVEVRTVESDSVVIPAQLNLEADSTYSVFVIDSADNAELLVINDKLVDPPAGAAHIRFVNLSPDAPELDLVRDNNKMVVPDRGFKEHSDFEPLAAGTHSFELRVAGTDSVLIKFPEVLLLAGKIYTFVSNGFVQGAGEQKLRVEMIENK